MASHSSEATTLPPTILVMKGKAKDDNDDDDDDDDDAKGNNNQNAIVAYALSDDSDSKQQSNLNLSPPTLTRQNQLRSPITTSPGGYSPSIPGAYALAATTTSATTRMMEVTNQGGQQQQQMQRSNADGNNIHPTLTTPRSEEEQRQQQQQEEGLVEALPVQYDDTIMDYSIQHAEEMVDPEMNVHPQQGRSAANRRRRRSQSDSTHKLEEKIISSCSIAAFLAFMMILIVLVLILSLSYQHHPKNSHTHEPAEAKPTSTTTRPTESPTSSPLIRMESQINAMLPDFSKYALLKDSSSPQRQAMDWLLADPHLMDLLVVPNSDDNDELESYQQQRILTRFCLATLYFALNGNNWIQNDHWLDYNVHECDWTIRKENFNGVREETEVAPQACIDIEEREISTTRDKEILKYKEQYMSLSPNNSNRTTISTTTTSRHRRIYRNIWLDTNNLDGSLPLEIFMIPTLQIISLVNNNKLWGKLDGPNIIQAQQQQHSLLLSELSISATQISGSIPSQLGRLSNLNYLVLAANRLTGTIPTELSFLHKNLRLLIVDSNQITGTIPPTSLGKLSRLSTLFLSNNELSGSIPSQLGNLSGMNAMALGNNRLTLYHPNWEICKT